MKFNVEAINLEGLNKHIEYVNKMLNMKEDEKFQKFIQEKVLELAKKVTNERLIGGTSNDEEIELYKSSHHIQEVADGFILYNNAKIEADKYNILPFDTSGYPEGQFSIALAFEYGVGITGEGTYQGDYFQPWNYNDVSLSKSKHRKAESWYLPSSVFGESGRLYSGYEGFEIYRNIAIEAEKNLKKWVNEYYSLKN